MLQNVETEQQIWDKDGNGHINLLICNPVFFGNVAITVFTQKLLLSFHIFATYLPRANL